MYGGHSRNYPNPQRTKNQDGANLGMDLCDVYFVNGCDTCCAIDSPTCLFELQEQYIFIHDAILELVTCGDTQIDAVNLRKSLHHLLKKNESGSSNLEVQFSVSYC